MSWKVIKEMKENRAKAFADAKTIRETAAKETRDLNTEEETRHASLLAEVENYGKRIEREERVAALDEQIGESRSMIGREDAEPFMPQKEMKRYSLLRAVNRMISHQTLDGIEGEVNAEIARRSGRSAKGFYVPLWSLRTPLNLTTGTGAVGVTLEGGDPIELLRNQMVMAQLGANVLTGMHGKFSIPRQSAGGTAYWLAESGSPTVSNQTLDQVAFVPKTVGAYTDISRSFIVQSSIDAENFVRNDLINVLAREIDKSALAGATGGNNPVGILYQSGTNAIDHGTNGSVEDWASIVSYETEVLAANVSPQSKFAYVTNSSVAGVLKTTDKTSGGYGQFIYSGGKINEYTAAVTNAMPSALTKGSSTAICSSMIFGNFSDCVISLWGDGLDLMVDPYTGSTSGTIRLVALQEADVQLRHAASFSVAKDILIA